LAQNRDAPDPTEEAYHSAWALTVF
jgi:hypothetical protein